MFLFGVTLIYQNLMKRPSWIRRMGRLDARHIGFA
jgi:hypothetical protein